jgi:dienelactone hydrolase
MSLGGAVTSKTIVVLAALLTGFLVSARASTVYDSLPGVKPDSPLVERDLVVEVEQPTAKLRVTVFFPPYGGPFPLALVNHGAAHVPKTMPKYGDEFIPYYFLSRGYAVALPLMRGYGDSEGHMARAGCDMVLEGNRAAVDIRKILDVVKSEPAIDSSKIIVAGKSMGGWHTLAFGATQPADVRAIASFSGGGQRVGLRYAGPSAHSRECRLRRKNQDKIDLVFWRK